MPVFHPEATRLHRRTLPLIGGLLAALLPLSLAAADPPAPLPLPPAEADAPPPLAPESIEQLRELQARVERVARDTAAATVALDLRYSGTGSGVIISEDGYILTAAHVIGDADRILQVRFPDGQVHPARTLGSDQRSDAGLAKLEGDGPWPHVPIAPAGSLDVGQWVVALGHPGGFAPERPAVVRLGRVIRVRPLVGIQSDCSLIGGDSGGPLFDLHGRVVGIHSRIGRGPRTNIHVPIADYLESWERLAAGRQWGERKSPLLGVALGPDPADRGVLIQQVLRRSAAARAGLRRGDIILALDEVATRDSDTILEHMSLQLPGDVVQVHVLRGETQLTLPATLGEVPTR
ncbi:MAG: trypsin-like peptidase domain-containing protein [Planctomycetota bacterium]